MRAITRGLIAAACLGAAASSSSATDADRGPIDGLADELSHRLDVEDYRGAFAESVLSFGSQELEFFGIEQDSGQPLKFVRSLPTYLKRMYPKEFRTHDSGGDMSDRLDAFIPAAADAWRCFLEARLDALDALVALADECGHRGNPKGVAKLRTVLAKARGRIAGAASTKSARARFDRMLRIYVVDSDEAVRLGLGPSGLTDETSVSARFGKRVLDGAPRGDSDVHPIMTFSGGSLVLHASFSEGLAHGRDGYFAWSHLLDLRADGVVAAGTFAVASATLRTIRSPCDGDGECDEPDVDRSYELLSGSLIVTDLCADRIGGTFELQLGDTSGKSVFKVRSGQFNVPTSVH